MKPDTATRISTLRRSLGLNQHQFAAALGIPWSTLSKWETGVRSPSGAAATLISLLIAHPHLVTGFLLPLSQQQPDA